LELPPPSFDCLLALRHKLQTRLPGAHSTAPSVMADIQQSSWGQRRLANNSFKGKVPRMGNVHDFDFVDKPDSSGIPDTTEGCAQLMAKVLAAGDLSSAEACLEVMVSKSKGFSMKHFCLTVLKMSANSGNTAAAAWCMECMAENGIVPSVKAFNTLLNAGAKAGDLALVEKWWNSMSKGCEPTAVSYNIMISACAQAKNGNRAEYWFDKMVRDGFKPCNVTYGTLIDANAKRGNAVQAQLWALRMYSAGITLDIMAYNSLISVCGKSGDLVKAEFWLNHMISSKLEPNEKVYNSFIHACGKCGALGKAEEWFERMEKSGCKTDMISYSSMIFAAAKVGNLRRAEWWMEYMLKQGFTPNIICVNTLLHACARKGDIQTAAMWFARAQQFNIHPTEVSFNSVIDACVTGASVSEAVYWVQRMITDGFHPNEITILTLSRWGAGHEQGTSRTRDMPRWAYDAMATAYSEIGSHVEAAHWQAQLAGLPQYHADPGAPAAAQGAPFSGRQGRAQGGQADQPIGKTRGKHPQQQQQPQQQRWRQQQQQAQQQPRLQQHRQQSNQVKQCEHLQQQQQQEQQPEHLLQQQRQTQRDSEQFYNSVGALHPTMLFSACGKEGEQRHAAEVTAASTCGGPSDDEDTRSGASSLGMNNISVVWRLSV